MTAQSIGVIRRRRRRKTARNRLPRDLIVLVLLVGALYLGARLLMPHLASIPAPPASAPPPPSAAIEAPALPVLPAPPVMELSGGPAPQLRVRRIPAHVLPETPDTPAAPYDPFAGLEPLNAAELAAISQAH